MNSGAAPSPRLCTCDSRKAAPVESKDKIMKLEISLIAPTSVISYVNLFSLASQAHSLHRIITSIVFMGLILFMIKN